MGKAKRMAKRMGKKQIVEKLSELFSSQPGKSLSFKDIFKALKLVTHPLKMLAMDTMEEMAWDDYLVKTSDNSYKLNTNGQVQEGSLFDDAEESAPKESPKAQKSILKDETVVTPDGAAYKEVPLIITKVYDEKMNIVKTQQEAKTIQSQTSDRNLKDKVEKLFRQGMQIDDIAAELSCPASEVQFIIDML